VVKIPSVNNDNIVVRNVKIPEVKTLDDLISLGKSYVPNAHDRYNFDINRLNRIVPSLEKLKHVIGMSKVKETVVSHILYFLAELQDKNSDMLHTVIEGPPGVGKTMLGKIIGEIYHNMNIIEQPPPEPKVRRYSDEEEQPRKRRRTEMNFVVARRSDLIAKYLGQTAIKTQHVIDNALGGVLFIDEAYSLGNAEKSDSFSKECIDTINQNLTEKKNQLLCIIAGYKEALDKSFFAYNEGLARRFPFRYTIDKYTPDELSQLFEKMTRDIGDGWKYSGSKTELVKMFEENYDYFPHFGGDIETLVLQTKIAHAKRVYCMETKEKKRISFEDVEAAFKSFCSNKTMPEKPDDTSLNMMYI
jgi:SpoVK/Ycf46/Vps4 family AAA+-type ATPase